MNPGGQAVKSMNITSSTVSCKSGDWVSDNFPAGLRVLVVDDDRTCLIILERMLRKCLYEVKKCNRAEDALFHLRENKNRYDIVISDVHMPDMDGFKLLEHIGLEMDLPVIMMSADDSKNVVMKGVTHGACDYLIKPVRIEALRNIWQHVVRRKKHECREFEQSGSAEDGGERQQKPPEEADYSSSVNEGSCRNSKRRKEEEDDAEERDDSSSLKKPRVVWSVELHQQFVAAVNQLGIDKAVPKKILELMNVPGLTRENVASHLQKYRLYLRRLSGVSQHQSGLSNSFMGNPEAAFGSISSLNGLDLQALAATGQLPAQSLAALGRSTSKSAISMPLVDQRNLFSFERYEEGQQQLLNNNNSKPMNLLHGIPTNMEAKQLVSLHQSTQSFGGMNMHVGQQQSRPQIMNESNGNQVSRFPSSMGQSMGPILSNGMVGGVYNQVPQSSSMVDFSMNHNTDLATNSFPLGGILGVSGLTSKGVLQEEVNLEMKGSRGLVSSYDIFEELHQHKPQDWGLQNVGLALDASRQTNIQGNVGVSSSVLVHQGYSSSQKTGGQNRNSYIGQQLNTPPIDHSLRIKAESLSEASYQNTLYPVQFGQEDLMAALLKQQQEGIGQVENEFGFDGYPLDNLPV